MEMDEKQIQIQEEGLPTKCRILTFFGLHNQVRVISVLLALVCGFMLASVFHQQLELYPFQTVCLYLSAGCLAPLLIGAFVTIPALYAPAVYIMRVAMISVILTNTMMIVETSNELDTFTRESTLRSKSSTIYYLNRNFKILSHCFNLSVQAWICLLIFGCLQLVTKDYHRLRSSKTSRGFCIGRRIRRFVTLDSLRFNRPKSPIFEMDPTGKVVEAKVEAFGHESGPDGIQVVPSQDQAEHNETEDQKAQLKMSPNQQVPQMAQQQDKTPSNPHPIQLLQEQIAKFNRAHEPTQPQTVPDEQVEPVNDASQEQAPEHQEQKPEQIQPQYETFAC